MKIKRLHKYICITIIIWGIANLIGYGIYRHNLAEKANLTFKESLEREKLHYIKRSISIHKTDTTEDKSVSLTEKEEWIKQLYINMEDPTRIYLDSTFSALLLEENIQTESFVSCTYNKNTNSTGTPEQIKQYTPLLPVVYRFDNDRKKDIILQPYINITVSQWLNYPYILLITGGCILYLICITFYIEKKAHKPNGNKELSITNDNEYEKIPLSNGWKLYPDKHILKNESNEIKLTYTETLYITAFLKAEEHKLKYTDICKQIYHISYEDENEVNRTEKQRIGQAIARLRKSLNCIQEITIVSIQNGYQLQLGFIEITALL